jgi:hypothetical protein
MIVEVDRRSARSNAAVGGIVAQHGHGERHHRQRGETTSDAARHE